MSDRIEEENQTVISKENSHPFQIKDESKEFDEGFFVNPKRYTFGGVIPNNVVLAADFIPEKKLENLDHSYMEDPFESNPAPKIPPFDQKDLDNPQACSAYAEHIFQYLLEAEVYIFSNKETKLNL